MTMSHAMPPAASHVARFLSFSYTFFRKETNSYGHSVTKSAQAAAFMNPTQRSRIAFENMIFLLKKTKTLVNQPALSQSPERESIAWAHRNIKFDCSCTYLNRSVKLSTGVDFGREQTRPLGLLARAQKYLPEAGRHRKRKAQGHTSKFRIPKERPLKDAIPCISPLSWLPWCYEEKVSHQDKVW